MPTIQQLEQALIAADRAGDTQAAATLAQALKAARASPPAKPDVSPLSAGLQGTADSAAFGFGDEIGAALDIDILKGDWGGQYARALEERRTKLKAAQEAQPAAFLGGQVAGVLPTAFIPGAAPARAAGVLGRIRQGAGVGAAAGAAYGVGSGEGTTDRVVGALTGGATGALGGAAGSAAMDAVLAGGRYLGQGATSLVRGTFMPEREAARRIGVAGAADNAIPQPRLTPQDEAAALANGQPVFNVDRGGETTRALARSAANQSPQARALLNNAIDTRYQTQGDRTVDLVRRIVGGMSNVANRAQLQTAARRANAPAYRAAYAAGDRPINSPELERLMTSPDVVGAMQEAARKGKSVAVAEGHGGFNANVRVTDDGRVIFTKGEAGMPTYPNIQFWDYTYRALRDAGRAATRQGKDSEGATLTSLSRTLRDELDRMVPEFGRARSTAAQFFGAEDALEAGERFVTSRMGNDEARQAVARMSAPERQLFTEGFADALVRRVNEEPNRRNIINQIFLTSPASRERIEIALGSQRARELESMLRVEDYLDRARQIVQGNSTTTRQLVELGLVSSGTGGYGLGTGDWRPAMLGAGLMGVRAGKAAINRQVATQVGELLASPDPRRVQQGLAMVARSDDLFAAIRSLDVPAAAIGGTQAARASFPPYRQDAVPAGMLAR